MLRTLSIRWRLALISAALTFVILLGFAMVIGQLTAERIHSDFNNQLSSAADDLQSKIDVVLVNGRLRITPDLDFYAGPENAAIRVATDDGFKVGGTRNVPDFGPPVPGTVTVGGYRVASRQVYLEPAGHVVVQYARRLSDVHATVAKVRVFLLFGVLAGTGLALGGGLVLAGRAMRPVVRLTATARDIARTRDPNQRVPVPQTDDEVTELARTLDDMLQALGASRAETQAMLARQQEFVADASHELRTPLTSVLANLELLADALDDEQGEAARSALRSANRMRRLLADLLLLARADAQRPAALAPTDLREVVTDAAAELGPIADDHEVSVDAAAVVVAGARDDLHRLVLNLLENAIRHTPPGTRVSATVDVVDGEARLVVADDGPGVPPDMRERLFERFARGSGDRGGSFGLGLSIVKAVAESHGGSVELDPGDGHGARFVVRLPAARAAVPA
jgi:two-component system, OmpR family, sensor kinase